MEGILVSLYDVLKHIRRLVSVDMQKGDILCHNLVSDSFDLDGVIIQKGFEVFEIQV